MGPANISSPQCFIGRIGDCGSVVDTVSNFCIDGTFMESPLLLALRKYNTDRRNRRIGQSQPLSHRKGNAAAEGGRDSTELQ
mmetsp:Transcript_30690/g.74345  ORF Transcript_30690/g.74345 Transcript_30690/m.74345 type:complete len:82 (-) Transcript_30690:876-1121(-)